MKRKYYLFVGLFVLLLGLNNLLQIPQPKNKQNKSLTNLDLWTKDKDFRYTETKNLSPYAMFGDNSMVLRTKQEREGKHSLEIVNRDMYSQIARLELDYKKGIVTLIGREGNILDIVKLNLRVLSKFLSIDPLTDLQPYYTPYNFVANSPNLYIDPDGQIQIPAWDKVKDQFTANGLTKEDYSNFTSIVQNAYGVLIKNNDRAMESIMKSTGLSKNTIINQLSNPNAGPTVNFINATSHSPDANSISIDIKTVRSLSTRINAGFDDETSSWTKFSFRDSSKKEQAIAVLGLAVLIIHEYIHTGDMRTNSDYKETNINWLTSGQWWMAGGQVNYDPYGTKYGKQEWKESITGHRGDDFAFYTYNISYPAQTGTGMLMYQNPAKNIPSRAYNVMEKYGLEGIGQLPSDLDPTNSKNYNNIMQKFGVDRITPYSDPSRPKPKE